MKKTFLFLACLVLCLIPIAPAVCEGGAPDLTLLAVNVRKADALLLRSPGETYLIDTGTEESFDRLYAVLQEEGVRSLTGVILTHTDKDHAGGLKQLVRSDIEIGRVFASAYYNKKSESKHPAVKALKGTGEEVVFLSAGDSLPLSGGSLDVLGPLVHDTDKENNNSLVLMASCSSGKILLAGDMEFPEEKTLLDAGAALEADVLKIGNHGEDDATSNALIAAVKPRVAVISTNSDDEPDTPSPRVLRLLESWGIPVLVTQDAETGVLVTLKGGQVETELK